MKRIFTIVALILFVAGASAAGSGKASGKLVVGQKSKPFTHAWAIEKNGLIKIVLATGELEEPALYDAAVLQEAVGDGAVSAIVVHWTKTARLTRLRSSTRSCPPDWKCARSARSRRAGRATRRYRDACS
jgi:hypothetical protein